MSLIQYIKRDRSLSFSDWRYRLLHWVFGISPKTPSESPLPGFLYTHYCPLFHLTNILAILFPLIFLIKLVVGVLAMIGGFVMFVKHHVLPAVLKPIRKMLDAIAENRRKAALARMSTPEYLAMAEKEQKKKEISLLRSVYQLHDGDIDYILKHETYRFDILKDSEVREILEKIKVKEDAQAEAHKQRLLDAEARKKELAERMVFWIRFSQIFVKGLTAVVIALAILGLLYGLYAVTPLVFALVCSILVGLWDILLVVADFFMNISISGVLNFALQFFLVTVSALGLGWLLVHTAPPVFNKVSNLFSTPIEIMKQCFSATGTAICSAVDGVATFVVALYEDNCPVIKVVEEEEA